MIAAFICCMLGNAINGAAQNIDLPVTTNSSPTAPACVPKAGPSSRSSNGKSTSASQKPTATIVGQSQTAVLNPYPASSETGRSLATRDNSGLEQEAIARDALHRDPLATKLDFDNPVKAPLQCRPDEKKDSSSTMKALDTAKVH